MKCQVLFHLLRGWSLTNVIMPVSFQGNPNEPWLSNEDTNVHNAGPTALSDGRGDGDRKWWVAEEATHVRDLWQKKNKSHLVVTIPPLAPLTVPCHYSIPPNQTKLVCPCPLWHAHIITDVKIVEPWIPSQGEVLCDATCDFSSLSGHRNSKGCALVNWWWNPWYFQNNCLRTKPVWLALMLLLKGWYLNLAL